MKEFLARKDIVISWQRYGIDALGAMAQVLFCSLPTMIVFFVLQKQFAEGITGSVK